MFEGFIFSKLPAKSAEAYLSLIIKLVKFEKLSPGKNKSMILKYSRNNILTRSHDPIKLLVMMMGTLGLIKTTIPSLENQVELVIEFLMKICISILNGIENTFELRQILSMTLPIGRNSLYFMRQFRITKLLEEPKVVQIAERYWDGDESLPALIKSSYTRISRKIIANTKNVQSSSELGSPLSYIEWRKSLKARLLQSALVNLGYVIVIQILTSNLFALVIKIDKEFDDFQTAVNANDQDGIDDLNSKMSSVMNYQLSLIIINLVIFFGHITQLISQYIYSYLTRQFFNKPIYRDGQFLLECFGFLLAWVTLGYYIFLWTKSEKIDQAEALINVYIKHHVNMIYYFTLIAGICWVRAFTGLKLFKALNPFIYIFGFLVKDLFKYFLILLGTLVMFCSVFSTAFKDLPDFENFWKTLLTLTSHMLGGPNFEPFDGYDRRNTAIFIYMIFMVVIVIVVLNFIVAIQNSAYDEKKQRVDSIFVKHVIQKRSQFSTSKNCSNWFVSYLPPLNILALLAYLIVYPCTGFN